MDIYTPTQKRNLKGSAADYLRAVRLHTVIMGNVKCSMLRRSSVADPLGNGRAIRTPLKFLISVGSVQSVELDFVW